MQRREMLTVLGLGGATAVLAPKLAFAAETRAFGGKELAAAVDAAEARGHCRLGVAVLDLATGARFSHRGAERFPMCSTFKFPLSAAVLHASERARLSLDRRVPIRAADMLGNSPITKQHVGQTMRVVDLCHATMTVSDNAAANLLLPLIGGTDGFTAFMRSLGDTATRLDRMEPHLNEGTPGDPRDTTTPEAMVAAMRAMLFGTRLNAASRAQLIRWLVANKTGATRLRAGLPRGWRVGDKTGTGATSANDVAVIWPHAGRPPLLVASYLTDSRAAEADRYAVHADVARAIAASVA